MILLLTDGTREIGAGHVMRCLSIADEARALGGSCRFVLAHGDMAELVRSRGHEATVWPWLGPPGGAEALPPPEAWRTPSGRQHPAAPVVDVTVPSRDLRSHLRTQNHDGIKDSCGSSAQVACERAEVAARGVKEGILSDSFEVAPGVKQLLVDSYAVTGELLQRLRDDCRGWGAELFYMDDRSAFAYPCDTLINYNIYGDLDGYRSLYGDSPLPRLLLGPAYAPLRAEFRQEAAPDGAEGRNADDILVSTGGSDPGGMALALLREAIPQTEHRWHFVVGGLSPDREKLRQLAAAHPHLLVHEAVTSMAALMRSCGLAVSAAGSTLYELCATRTPTLTYVVADNQIPGADAFAARQIMEHCGDLRQLGREALASGLIRAAVALARDSARKQRMAAAMAQVTDGWGARRIAETILGNRGA